MPLRVDVWSDIACPWCWVGKRQLEAAAEQADVELQVHWHAFELNPAAPKTVDPSVPYVERLAKKYGVEVQTAQQMADRMCKVGEQVGIEFRFDKAQPTNTFDAHRLLAWAADSGKQNALGERLFGMYMTEGASVAERDVLLDAVEAVGLDAEAATAVLSGDDFVKAVREDEAAAGEMGVSGVPFFVVDRRFPVPGAQPVETLAKLLLRASEPMEITTSESEAGAEACGPDGCAV